MAINFYGSCTGNSASKYNTWINVSQNSQNVKGNQSNITVKFYLKRNDGYSESAYNLNEGDNTVRITVGSTVAVQKNTKIDTRNNASVLLGSWTGNVTHNADGILVLPISAQFVMANTGLRSGSVSANFTCTAIPRKSTLSLSSASVNPGSSVTATVSPASSGFSHKIIWSLGSKTAERTLASGVLTTQLTVPQEWAYELANASSGNISVSLVTYNGATDMGTNTYSLNLVIAATDQYKPDFSIGLTRINNTVPAEWDEYVQGISKVCVSPQGLTFKYGASLAAITVTVGSVSVRGTQNATFNLAEAGEQTVTVAVRDTRGFLTVKTTTITVCPYAPPSAKILNLFRCNSEGTEETCGTYLCAKYGLNFSGINGKNRCSISVRYKTANDTSYSTETQLSGSPSVFGGNISVNNSVEVCFTVRDSVSSNSVEIFRAVSSADIPFNIKRGGKGAAFGKYAENDNELSIGWNLGVDGNVNIGGELNYENTSILCSEYSGELAGGVKYYPWLRGCFVRIRVKAQTTLFANTTYIIAHIPNKIPGMFTPLCSLANYASGGVSTAGVVYKTGDVVFRSNIDVAEGTYIYISGFYMADYNE